MTETFYGSMGSVLEMINELNLQTSQPNDRDSAK